MESAQNHERWMQAALELAQRARAEGEVPVGAVVVHRGEIVGRGWNRREGNANPLHHAEILAIEEAAKSLGRWRLIDCTLYVTLEPCLMCAGAIVNSRVDTVVFGARDPKAGAVVSLYSTLSDSRLNHRPEVVPDILSVDCAQILKDFFKLRREQNLSRNATLTDSPATP